MPLLPLQGCRRSCQTGEPDEGWASALSVDLRLGHRAALGSGVPAAVPELRVWDRHWLLAGGADLQSAWPAGDWAAVVLCSPGQALHAGGWGDGGQGEALQGVRNSVTAQELKRALDHAADPALYLGCAAAAWGAEVLEQSSTDILCQPCISLICESTCDLQLIKVHRHAAVILDILQTQGLHLHHKSSVSDWTRESTPLYGNVAVACEL